MGKMDVRRGELSSNLRLYSMVIGMSVFIQFHPNEMPLLPRTNPIIDNPKTLIHLTRPRHLFLCLSPQLDDDAAHLNHNATDCKSQTSLSTLRA